MTFLASNFLGGIDYEGLTHAQRNAVAHRFEAALRLLNERKVSSEAAARYGLVVALLRAESAGNAEAGREKSRSDPVVLTAMRLGRTIPART